MLQNSWATLFALTLIGLLVCTAHAQTPKKEEKVRAYEFGFTIDQQQHRHEKRDERGIVMGEFGFITADGIYHVTVYATDEEGKFRILAMRNYPYESPPKTIDMIVKPKPKPTAVTTSAPLTTAALKTMIQKQVLPKLNFHTQGCAGCFLKNGDEPVKNPTKTAIRPLAQPLPLAPLQKPTNNLAKSPTPAAQQGKVEIVKTKVPQIYAGEIVTTANRKAVEKAIANDDAKRATDLLQIVETTFKPVEAIHVANVAASNVNEVKNTVKGDKIPTTTISTIKNTNANTQQKDLNTQAITQLTPITTQFTPKTTTQFTPKQSVENENIANLPANKVAQASSATTPTKSSNSNENKQKLPTTTQFTPTTIQFTPTTTQFTPIQSLGNENIANLPANNVAQASSATTPKKLSNSNESKQQLPTTYTTTETKSPTKLKATRYTNTPTFAGVNNKQTPTTQINTQTITNTPTTKLTTLSTLKVQSQKPTTISAAAIATQAKTPINAQKLEKSPIKKNSLDTEKTTGTTNIAATKDTPNLATTIKQSKPLSQPISNNALEFNIASSIIMANNINSIEAKTKANKAPGSSVKTQAITSLDVSANIPSSTLSTTPTTDRSIKYTTPLLQKSPITLKNTPKTQTNTPTLTLATITGKPASAVKSQTPSYTPTIQNNQKPAATAAGAIPQLSPKTPAANSGANALKPGTANKSASGAPQNPNASKPGTGNNAGGKENIDLRGSFADAGHTGGKTISGEPGDLYRFKYILDYNGHTETGSRNGNKEGNYFAIGEDNVERTIEYVANELGYQPRIRWRKLDAPVQSKENTLKEYEFVWFKQE